MGIQEEKDKLRKHLLSQRSNIPHDQWEHLSALIISRLMELPSFQQAQTLHCYVSMNKRGEVNTHPLIKQLLVNDKELVVPVTHMEEGVLTHHKLHSFDDLEPNKWGVPEPADGDEVPIADLDLVIIPMVAGDEDGNRLGYGGGFYDRFLKEFAGTKIGLIFEQNILPQLPVESFDIPLDMIVTEERIIQRN